MLVCEHAKQAPWRGGLLAWAKWHLMVLQVAVVC